MGFEIKHGDITTAQTDAIVNAANEHLAPGGGVCGAIFNKAGYRELDRACQQLGNCPTGSAVITPGFNLPASYVIHAVGPVWRGGDHNERELLKSAYTSSLELMKENDLDSIAFPLISSGIYGFPKEEARRIAEQAIQEFLEENPEKQVYLYLFK